MDPELVQRYVELLEQIRVANPEAFAAALDQSGIQSGGTGDSTPPQSIPADTRPVHQRELGNRVTPGQTSDGRDRLTRGPFSGRLNNPQLEVLLNALSHTMTSEELGQFVAATGLDINAPSYEDRQAYSETQAGLDRTHQTTLQDDAQEHELALADLQRQIAEINQGLGRRIGGTQTADGRYIAREGDLRESDLERLLAQYVADRQSGDFHAADNTVADRTLDNQLTAANLNVGNFEAGSKTLAGKRLQLDRDTLDQQGRIADADRQGRLDVANRQSEAVEYSAETSAGRYERKGVEINEDGEIIIDPKSIQESDLNRVNQALIARIQAGQVKAEDGTEAAAERDLRKEIAQIQAGQVTAATGTEAAAERTNLREVERIRQGLTAYERNTERDKDRDLQRDLSEDSINSIYGFAASGQNVQALRAAQAAQSTGGVTTSAGGARQFLDEQARISASGGLSNPEQIAKIQILQSVNNPYAFVQNYLDQQAEQEAATQIGARGNRAAGQFGLVGPSEQLGINQPRQTFNDPTQDSAIARATEVLRQTQLANAAPQIRQQNLDLLGDPQKLGAAVSLGGSDYIRDMLGVTSQFANSNVAKGDSFGIDPYLQNNPQLGEAIELFNNPNIQTDGRQLFTKDTMSSFSERSSTDQGFLVGGAAGAGITPDQLYRGVQSNTPNARDNQFASNFRVA